MGGWAKVVGYTETSTLTVSRQCGSPQNDNHLSRNRRVKLETVSCSMRVYTPNYKHQKLTLSSRHRSGVGSPQPALSPPSLSSPVPQQLQLCYLQ